MRKLHYIIGALVCVLLFSCEAEEVIKSSNNNSIAPEEDGTYLINPEDTANIVVPQGYKLVLFPGTKTQTRAVANGANTQIKHLQYLIYRKDETRAYKLVKQTILSNPANWPAKVPAIPLEENKEYRVVFLGNIDKALFGNAQTGELLDGTDIGANYADARIHLPEVEFNDANLFYMENQSFNTNTENIINNSVHVPITLKRIVSKVEICKAPLKDTSKGYTQDNLIEQVINQQIIGKLGVTGGALHRGIAAAVDTLVMAMVYVGTKDCAEAADNFYQKDQTTYPVLKYRYNNIGTGKEYQLQGLTGSLNNVVTSIRGTIAAISGDCEYAYAGADGDFKQNAVVRLAQYIYDYFHQGIDNAQSNENLFGGKGIVREAWSKVGVATIISENGLLSFDFENNKGLLNQLLTTDLKASFKKSVNSEDATDKLKRDFSPLGIKNTVYRVQVNRLPSVINFDRTIKGYFNNGNPTDLYLTAKMATEEYKGVSISVISLGTPTDKLVIQAMDGGYSRGSWNGSVLTKPTGGLNAQKKILLPGENLTVTQAANKYRKCVLSTGPVDIKDWSRSSSATSYPIPISTQRNMGIDPGIDALVGSSDVYPLKITAEDKNDPNYTRTLLINGQAIAPSMRFGTAENLVSIYIDIINKLKKRSNYVSYINTNIAWVPLSEIKNNLNDYTSSWTVTDENYATVNE